MNEPREEERRRKASARQVAQRARDLLPLSRPIGSDVRQWPPADRDEMVAAWKAAGSPEIPLSPGVSLVDLEKWFDPIVFIIPRDEEVDLVRRQVLLPKV